MTKCSVARQKFFPTHDVGTRVVDDDQEHHVGEGLGAVFPAVADQSNTGAFPDTGEFLRAGVKEIAFNWICAAHASSEPLLSSFARKGQCLC